jgi:predicted nuclease of predicted toxin-antitoxin system
MRFLIDADLPRPTADLVRSFGHEATDVRAIGLGGAPDDRIAAHAQEHGLCLLTGDFDFADIRDYPPEAYPGLVVFVFPDNADRDMILNLIKAFFEEGVVVETLPGRLAIAEPGRVRLRPA